MMEMSMADHVRAARKQQKENVAEAGGFSFCFVFFHFILSEPETSGMMSPTVRKSAPPLSSILLLHPEVRVTNLLVQSTQQSRLTITRKTIRAMNIRNE